MRNSIDRSDRDRISSDVTVIQAAFVLLGRIGWDRAPQVLAGALAPVSYTHLTLPTILRV